MLMQNFGVINKEYHGTRVMVFSGVVNLHVSLYVRKPPVQIFMPLPLVTSSVLMVIDNFDIYFAQGKEIFRTIYPNKNN